MRQKKIFCIIGRFIVSHYIAFLDSHVCINNPYRQSSGIIIFLRRYYVVISHTLIGSKMSFSCRLLQYYQSFIRNSEEKLELQKKYIEEFV